MLVANLIARVTTGRPMPFTGITSPPAGAVLLQSEDSLSWTVRPRLVAAGADLSRVLAVDAGRFRDDPLVLPEHLDFIADEAARVNARLLVIDPFAAFVAGNTHAEVAMRPTLGRLAVLAEQLDLAVVLVRHLRKSGASNALHRGLGSMAIVAAARAAFLASRDPTSSDPHRYVLTQVKNNLGSAQSLAYRTVVVDSAPIIEWLGPAPEIATDLHGTSHDDPCALEEAKGVLGQLLRDGPMRAREVIQLATAEAGISKRTLDRAKKTLGVRTRKHGCGRGSWWTWELTADCPMPHLEPHNAPCNGTCGSMAQDSAESVASAQSQLIGPVWAGASGPGVAPYSAPAD